MKSLWNQLREESSPSSSFREDLCARIHEESVEKEKQFFIRYISKITIPKPNLVLKIEKQYSFVNRVRDFFSAVQQKTVRLTSLIAGGVIAGIVIIPMLSLFTISPSSASEPSVLRNIEGTVLLERKNTTSVFSGSDSSQEIFDNDTITTGPESTVEIVFFEGSILRLAENTSIEIAKITPHPFLFSAGGIHIKVKNGMVWGKTFQLSEEETGIVLHTPSTTLFPERAVFSVSYMDGKDSIFVFENTVDVELSGVVIENNTELFGGEYLIFSPFDDFIPLHERISLEFEKSEWVVSNTEKDKEYTSEYLERIGKSMKEEYIVGALGSQIEAFLDSNPDPDSVESLILDINNLLLSAHTHGLQEEKDTVEDIEDLVPEKLYTEPFVVHPESFPRSVSSRGEERSQNTPLIPEESLQNSEEERQEEEVLREQEKIKKTASQIAEVYHAQKRKEKIEAISESFVSQIEVFEFESSRNTQAQNLIDKIPNNSENLDLLKYLEENSPRDVKKIVKQKRIEVEKNLLYEQEQLLNESLEAEAIQQEDEEALIK